MEPLVRHHTKKISHEGSGLARQVVSDPIVLLEPHESRINAEEIGDLDILTVLMFRSRKLIIAPQ